jgi:hypothetical protein
MNSLKQDIPIISGFSKLNRSERIEWLQKILGTEIDLHPWLDAWMHPSS